MIPHDLHTPSHTIQLRMIGSGTGENAVFISHQVGAAGSVTAFDLSPDAISIARSRAATAAEASEASRASRAPQGSANCRVRFVVDSAMGLEAESSPGTINTINTIKRLLQLIRTTRLRIIH